MKKILVLLTVLFVALTGVSAREREMVTKEKKTHNEYKVQDMDRLMIENMYGKVHINTWDKNEITIDISVTVKARTDADAQAILDRISFVMSSNEEGGHKVFCKTVLEPMRHNVQNSEMSIDYTINAPKKNPIDITNKYGDVYLGDFSGKMRMNVMYGGLDMQTITGNDKRIKVAFGSVAAESLETGMLDVSYSNVSIRKARDIDVTNKFGKLDIEEVQDLKLDQRYGDVEIGSVNKISGNVDYANVEIDDLSKSLQLILKYCGRVNLKAINAGVDMINMEAGYSNLYYHFAEGANMSVSMATSYSAIKGNISAQMFEQDDNNNTRYKAKVGKGEGTMIVTAHYSNIYFR